MSGPITRQYGVPNWDDIFGKKEDQPASLKASKDSVDQVESRDADNASDRKGDSADS